MPENFNDASTREYQIEIIRSRSEGVIACPVAGEGEDVSLIRLNSAIEFLTVYWNATKQGAPPILPSHKSFVNNYNRVFLGGQVHGVVIPTIGCHIWCVAGSFSYVLKKQEGLLSILPVSKMPWEDTSETEFYIPVENFQEGILNAAQLIDYSFTTPPADVVFLNGILK